MDVPSAKAPAFAGMTISGRFAKRPYVWGGITRGKAGLKPAPTCLLRLRVNPLRLAALDASPFCVAKGGGKGVGLCEDGRPLGSPLRAPFVLRTFPPLAGETLPRGPPRSPSP